ncbi:MAG: HAD hydrolase-like protein [Anaerolineae bacterium]|nr:HAD hydrolase-like protein [Anaerolineae bacterium]
MRRKAGAVRPGGAAGAHHHLRGGDRALPQEAQPRRACVRGGDARPRADNGRRRLTIADEDVAFVVAGIDRGLTYAKVATANRLIREGATFIGTNPDRTFPLPTGPAPGAGSILAAIATASDQEPTIIGKPYAAMFEQALDVVQTPAARTAMVGDRLETDILGGQRAGLRTVLVCTGINRREDLAASPVQPDFVFDDLPDFLHQWRAARSG